MTSIIVTPVAFFSGLEARVVLLVAPERFTRKNQPDIELGIHNPRYKAFVASRGVYRVTFVIENELNPGIVKSMEFEELQTITRSVRYYFPISISTRNCIIIKKEMIKVSSISESLCPLPITTSKVSNF